MTQWNVFVCILRPLQINSDFWAAGKSFVLVVNTASGPQLFHRHECVTLWGPTVVTFLALQESSTSHHWDGHIHLITWLSISACAIWGHMSPKRLNMVDLATEALISLILGKLLAVAWIFLPITKFICWNFNRQGDGLRSWSLLRGDRVIRPEPS